MIHSTFDNVIRFVPYYPAFDLNPKNQERKTGLNPFHYEQLSANIFASLLPRLCSGNTTIHEYFSRNVHWGEPSIYFSTPPLYGKQD
jgi:hypothetical protein